MKSGKIEQPKGIIAGACFLLATFSMSILVQLAYGNVPFANLLNNIIYPYGFAEVLESIAWLLVFPAGIFAVILAGITLLTDNPNLKLITTICAAIGLLTDAGRRIYLVRDYYSAGKGVIAGAITGVVFTIIYTVAMVAMMANY